MIISDKRTRLNHLDGVGRYHILCIIPNSTYFIEPGVDLVVRIYSCLYDAADLTAGGNFSGNGSICVPVFSSSGEGCRRAVICGGDDKGRVENAYQYSTRRVDEGRKC